MGDKKAQKYGNPAWHKGMPAPPGAGRPKGSKDSPLSMRRERRTVAEGMKELNRCARKRGFTNIWDMMLDHAEKNAEYKHWLMTKIAEVRLPKDIDPVEEGIIRSGYSRDVRVAQAEAAKAADAPAGGVTLVLPQVLQPSEGQRVVEAIDVKALTVDTEPAREVGEEEKPGWEDEDGL